MFSQRFGHLCQSCPSSTWCRVSYHPSESGCVAYDDRQGYKVSLVNTTNESQVFAESESFEIQDGEGVHGSSTPSPYPPSHVSLFILSLHL